VLSGLTTRGFSTNGTSGSLRTSANNRYVSHYDREDPCEEQKALVSGLDPDIICVEVVK